MSSDDFLLNIHNKISSSSDIEETSCILKAYPQVLSFHVWDWGGSIVLHTVCSRQPKNFKLIEYIAKEGIKYKVGRSDDARGGLLIPDNFGRTPLNILVSNNAIHTLRYLTQTNPPLMAPEDVLESKLLNSVHSTYHVDMVRFLVHLYPKCVSKIFNNFGLLIHQMCVQVSDCKFLLRVIPILIEEGIRQQVGGEYGIGGLFAAHLGLTVADLLIDRRDQSWNSLAPIIRGAIINEPSPILHGAIMAKTVSQSYSAHIVGICKYLENAAFTRDSQGRLAIHIAAEQGLRWRFDHMEDIVEANVLAVKENDPLSGLPIYALAAVGTRSSLSTIYELISLCVDDFV